MNERYVKMIKKGKKWFALRNIQYDDYPYKKSHIPDKGQVTVCYIGLYANAHRGKVRKMEGCEQKFILIEEECPRIPRRGWAEIIRG